jgi:hypothetical protein
MIRQFRHAKRQITFSLTFVIFARFVVTRGLGLWQITAFPPKFLGRGVQGNHQRSVRAIAAHAFERQRTGFLPGDFILTRF